MLEVVERCLKLWACNIYLLISRNFFTPYIRVKGSDLFFFDGGCRCVTAGGEHDAGASDPALPARATGGPAVRADGHSRTAHIQGHVDVGEGKIAYLKVLGGVA